MDLQCNNIFVGLYFHEVSFKIKTGPAVKAEAALFGLGSRAWDSKSSGVGRSQLQDFSIVYNNNNNNINCRKIYTVSGKRSHSFLCITRSAASGAAGVMWSIRRILRTSRAIAAFIMR